MITRGNNPRRASGAAAEQQSLYLAPPADEHLSIGVLETWLCDAASAIRGATDAPKVKDFILPLFFYKRLSDAFDDEFAQYVREFGDEAPAREIIEAADADLNAVLARQGLTDARGSCRHHAIARRPCDETAVYREHLA